MVEDRIRSIIVYNRSHSDRTKDTNSSPCLALDHLCHATVLLAASRSLLLHFFSLQVEGGRHVPGGVPAALPHLQPGVLAHVPAHARGLTGRGGVGLERRTAAARAAGPGGAGRQGGTGDSPRDAAFAGAAPRHLHQPLAPRQPGLQGAGRRKAGHQVPDDGRRAPASLRILLVVLLRGPVQAPRVRHPGPVRRGHVTADPRERRGCAGNQHQEDAAFKTI